MLYSLQVKQPSRHGLKKKTKSTIKPQSLQASKIRPTTPSSYPFCQAYSNCPTKLHVYLRIRCVSDADSADAPGEEPFKRSSRAQGAGFDTLNPKPLTGIRTVEDLGLQASCIKAPQMDLGGACVRVSNSDFGAPTRAAPLQGQGISRRAAVRGAVAMTCTRPEIMERPC